MNKASAPLVSMGLVAVAIVCAASAAASGGVRLCVSAGSLIPETTEGLRSAVVRLLDEADAPVRNEPLLACVVPHGPYGISGSVAAASFKHLQKGQFKRVIVLGSSHAEMAFEDCSIAAVDAYATPMGLVPLDGPAVRKLCYSALFGARSMRYAHLRRGFLTESERKPLHEYEHSIEIVLPFLQERLGSFELVPVLIGTLTDGGNNYDPNRAIAVANQLKKIIDDETLVVVSTDFTHFGNDFSYRPFNTDILNKIDKLDDAGLLALGSNSVEEFEDYITRTRVPICGLNALRVLLHLLPPRAEGVRLGHALSGRFYNDENRSVSYASMNFYLSDKPKFVPPPPPPVEKVEEPKKDDAPRRAPLTFNNSGVQPAG